MKKLYLIFLFVILVTHNTEMVTATGVYKSIDGHTDIPVAEAPYVILTNLTNEDPYFEAVSLLQKHRNAQVLKFDPANVASLAEKLRMISPAFVCVILHPESLDINLNYDIFDLSTQLDEDPFPDFTYGFITGSTADNAVAMIKNMIRAESNPNDIPQRLMAFGPTNVSQADDKSNFDWLTGWQRSRLAHKPGNFSQEHIDQLINKGIIRFWGHGTPRDVDGSLSYSQLKNSKLYPAVVFAGPCFSAVVHRYYEWDCCDTSINENHVPSEESLALMFTTKGATAYFGALHEDRCVSAAWEMEYVLATGDALGGVMKHTYDTVVMARGGKRLTFPRLKDGQTPPEENSVDFQINRAAGRILLGDPAYQPFLKAAPYPIKTAMHYTVEGLEIEASVVEPRMRSSFVDVFHSDLCTCNTPDDVLYFRVELPDDFPESYSVLHMEENCPLKDVRHSNIVWAEESWLGKRYLHIQIGFEHCSLKNKNLKFNFKVNNEL